MLVIWKQCFIEFCVFVDEEGDVKTTDSVAETTINKLQGRTHTGNISAYPSLCQWSVSTYKKCVDEEQLESSSGTVSAICAESLVQHRHNGGTKTGRRRLKSNTHKVAGERRLWLTAGPPSVFPKTLSAEISVKRYHESGGIVH